MFQTTAIYFLLQVIANKYHQPPQTRKNKHKENTNEQIQLDGTLLVGVMMSDIRRRATPVGANPTYFKVFVFLKREEEGYNDAIVD